MNKQEIKKLNSSVSENQGSRAKREVLINQGESETLEFKASLSDWRDILETISAFANSKGGKVLVGVEESGNIQGTILGKRTMKIGIL